MSRLRLIAALAFALLLALPATALAATWDVAGTVTDTDGNPVAGVEIAILVQGTDTVLSATSDANGAWGVQLDADPGATLEVNGTAPTTREQDGDCVISTTLSGQAKVVLPAEGTPDAVALVLDNPLTGKVCSETGKPDTSNVTPPPTDTIASSAATGNGALLLAGILAVIAAAVLVTTSVAAPRRR